MFKLNIIDTEKPSSHLNLDYLHQYGNGDTFIETGTYYGDTVQLALNAGFNKIHSVELDTVLFDKAVKRFANNDNVRIWYGDSVDSLKDILALVNGPATFWLDAHASGELVGGKSGGSPVVDELTIIQAHSCNEHTIFIDDRRLFGSAEWSFVKEEDAMELLRKINPNYKILYLDGHVPGDVICATVK